MSELELQPLSSRPGSQALDLDHRIAAVFTVMDREGSPGLTVEAVCRELSASPQHLLQALGDPVDPLGVLVDAAVDHVFDDALLSPAAASWQEYVVRLSQALRVTFLEHPALWSVVVARPSRWSWVRPPLPTLRSADVFLEQLHQYGFSDSAGVAAYRCLSRLFFGCVVPEMFSAAADVRAAREVNEIQMGAGALTGRPRLIALHAELSADRASEEFEEAVEHLVDQLAHHGPR